MLPKILRNLEQKYSEEKAFFYFVNATTIKVDDELTLDELKEIVSAMEQAQKEEGNATD